MLRWKLEPDVYTSDKQVVHRRAVVTEAVEARLLKSQLQEPPGGIILRS